MLVGWRLLPPRNSTAQRLTGLKTSTTGARDAAAVAGEDGRENDAVTDPRATHGLSLVHLLLIVPSFQFQLASLLRSLGSKRSEYGNGRPR